MSLYNPLSLYTPFNLYLFQTANVSTNSVYVSFNLKITSALENAKIKIQVTVTVGTAKIVYDTDDIPVGTMGKMLFR